MNLLLAILCMTGLIKALLLFIDVEGSRIGNNNVVGTRCKIVILAGHSFHITWLHSYSSRTRQYNYWKSLRYWGSMFNWNEWNYWRHGCHLWESTKSKNSKHHFTCNTERYPKSYHIGKLIDFSSRARHLYIRDIWNTFGKFYPNTIIWNVSKAPKCLQSGPLACFCPIKSNISWMKQNFIVITRI